MSSNWQPVERATGISKQQWLEFFEPHKDKDHKELAQLALEYVAEKAPECNQGWWAQYATINYEEILGRRKPGQRSDGKYGASASKTLPGGREEIVVAWAAWAEENLGLVGTVTSSEKWHYWRAKLGDVPLNANLSSKAAEKTVLALEARKIESKEAADALKEQIRGYLKEFASTLN